MGLMILSSEGRGLKLRHFAPSFQYLEPLLLGTTGQGGAAGIQWPEARDAAIYPAVHRMVIPCIPPYPEEASSPKRQRPHRWPTRPRVKVRVDVTMHAHPPHRGVGALSSPPLATR